MQIPQFRMAARTIAGLAAAALLVAVPVFSQMPSEGQGQGQAVVTILPEHNTAVPSVSQQALNLKINGKESTVTGWLPLTGSNDALELVVLIDGGARSSLGSQLNEIAHFIQTLQPDAKVGVAYMLNGRAAFSAPLSTDRAAVLRGLHVTAGTAGIDSSPYFCLSDLAQHWPSTDQTARREVVMVTDGVDYYNLRFDPEDPYLQAAITDAVRARLVVYSIYWRNTGRADRSMYETNAGQNLLTEVAQATGGNNYWEGYGNPVSFQPFLEDIDMRLHNQYELSFEAPLRGKPEVASLKLKLNGVTAKLDAPQQVFLTRPAVAGE